MMQVGVPKTVEKVEYSQKTLEGDVQPTHMLHIRTEDGQHLWIPNGHWNYENAALQVMAFLGASPSTLDSAAGQNILCTVNDEGDMVPADFVFQSGHSALKQAEWFDPETDC